MNQCDWNHLSPVIIYILNRIYLTEVFGERYTTKIGQQLVMLNVRERNPAITSKSTGNDDIFL